MGVKFDGTEYWYNIWRKTDLCFQKWHEEFSKFSSEHLKMSKLVFSWDPFVQSRKCMSLKFIGEFYVMTMKNDTKFEEELTCQFKIDMRNLTNFDLSTRKSQKLIGFFWWNKVCNAWAKKSIEELCLMALKLMQNLKETGLWFLKVFV